MDIYRVDRTERNKIIESAPAAKRNTSLSRWKPCLLQGVQKTWTFLKNVDGSLTFKVIYYVSETFTHSLPLDTFNDDMNFYMCRVTVHDSKNIFCHFSRFSTFI